MGLRREDEAGRIWVLYALIDPRDGLPFYVGSTVNLPNRLICHHSYDSSARPRMKALSQLGLAPIVKEHGTYTTKAAAWDAEYALIEATPGLLNIAKSLQCKKGCLCAKHDRTPFWDNPCWEAEFAAKRRAREQRCVA